MRRDQKIALVGLAVAVLAMLGGLVSLRMEVESRFRGDLFDVPARIYGRPLQLRRGMDVKGAGVVERLRRIGYREATEGSAESGEFASGPRRLVFVPHAAPAARIESAIVLRLDRRGRIRDILTDDRRPVSAVELEPELIGELYGSRHERRRLVTVDDVPEHLVTAILAVEDQRFYEHWGLDVLRIGGALFANLRAGRIVQGGSTITQQLVKNLYLSPERTVARKAREALMALLLELGHSKREILEAYLNEVYLGQHGSVSIHGFGEATRHYFGKDIADISLAESALLAGMIRAPGRYSPFQKPEVARERRDSVLGILREQGYLDAERAAEAAAEPIQLRAPERDERVAPHFGAWLRADLAEELGEHVLLSYGIDVHSTLDPQLQRVAQRAVARGLERLERDHPELGGEGEPLEGALLALDPANGDVLALVGGRDFGRSQFNRATQSRRQPGSVFKPVVALAAVSRNDDGSVPMTLATRVDDEPLVVDTPDGPWSPANFDGEFRGQVTLREAIERSLNVPMARVGLDVGPERIVATARRLGIQSRLAPVPSLALGPFELSLLEITRAYAVFASGGELPAIRNYTSVSDAHDEVLSEVAVEVERVFEAEEVYLVTSALEGVIDRGTGRAVRGYGVEGPVAGKTGTTNDFRDAWFVGYTPSLVVGVWVGFDDARSLGVPASVAALPIFAEFVRRGTGGELAEPFYRPKGVRSVSIHRPTGKRAGFGCRGEREVFLRGTAPTERCATSLFEAATNPFRFLFKRHPFGRKRDRAEPEPPMPPAQRRGTAASPESGPAPGWEGGVWVDPDHRRPDE